MRLFTNHFPQSPRQPRTGGVANDRLNARSHTAAAAKGEGNYRVSMAKNGMV